MKLEQDLRFDVEEQLGVDAVHDAHPIASELRDVFGDHTFFLDDRGLCIVVPKPAPEVTTGNVVRVASWSDDFRDLLVHDPEILPEVVDLAAGEADAALSRLNDDK